MNIFFGQSHCLGETKRVCLPINLDAEYGRDLKRTMAEILVDMARFFRFFQLYDPFFLASWFGVFLGVSILSLVELIYCVLLGKQ